ncbi:hypothetical protein [Enterococcus faecium]|uniref:hypothetical protein n=1 Tax=Enterococcus faecium TaxID=1352 RepID=UPI0031379FF2
MEPKFENRSDTRCGSFLYILYEVFFIPYEKISLKIKKDENKRFSIKRRPFIFCLYLCEKRKRESIKYFV